MNKRLIFFVLVLIGCPLLIAMSWLADFPSMLQRQFKTFVDQRGRVDVHIIFNQPRYVGGDTVFMKAYLSHGEQQRLQAGKRIVNVQLVSPQRSILLHERMVSNEGIASGQFVLPENLLPGYYSLLAYIDDPGDGISTPVNQFDLQVAGEKEMRIRRNAVELFAEGGSLPAGVRTKVVARLSGHARLVKASGAIIAELSPDSNGLATVYITPVAGETYIAEAGIDNSRLETLTEGVGLQVENTGHRSFDVRVQPSPGSHWARESLFAVISSPTSLVYSKEIKFDGDSAVRFSVPWPDNTMGLGRVTLFSDKGVQIAERLVWVEPTSINVRVKTDAKEYGVRKAVRAELEIGDVRGVSASAEFTVSVYKEELFGDMGSRTFERQFLGDTRLKRNESPNESLSLDELVTRSWNSFAWDDVINAAPTRSTQPNLYYFRGKVLSRSGKTIPDSTAISFFLNKNDFVYVIYTKKNAEFEFPLFMDFGSDVLYYVIRSRGKENRDAYLAASPLPEPAQSPAATLEGTETDPYFAYTRARKPILKSYAYYAGNGHKEPPLDVDLSEFDDADISVDVQKYKKFSSMSEVLVEVVPALRQKKVGDKNAVRVFMQDVAMFGAADPLYFIDGVITDSTDYFLSLDPDRLAQIKVLRSQKTLRRFGDLGKNGIVVVQNRTPDPSIVPRGKRTLAITGVSTPFAFHSPAYNAAANSMIPDLRAALYWNAHIKTGEDGKASFTFFTSDVTGSFVVVVDGVTSSGQPFSRKAQFNVTLDHP